MSKVTLIINDSDFTVLHSSYLESLFNEYFNVVRFDPNSKYDKNCIIVTGCLNNNKWYKHLDNKVIVDNLWEELIPNNIPSAHIWTNKNWFWYNESLWYTELGYNSYIPTKTYNKLALMPMNMQHIHRDMLYDTIKPYLNQFIYSYVSRGIVLPGTDFNSATWQRFFNKQWYDDTYFSLVAETSALESGLFITEKTFKPMAYYHPFMILGQMNVLSYLRSQGFKTYDNLFDESYDSEPNIVNRIAKIVDNVKNFNQIEYDNITKSKLIHNHNLFFNKELIIERIRKEIIQPTLEYAET
jgi:hypothetical protein